MRFIPVIKSIKTKLFLTLLMASSGVVITMFLVMQWSFDRGFLNYVNTQDRQHVRNLSAALAHVYREHRSWEMLAGDHRQWHQLIRTHAAELLSPGGSPPPPPRHEGRGPGGGSHDARRPPPPRGEIPPRTGHRPLPHHAPPRVALYDAQQQAIFGPNPGGDSLVLSPIQSQGRTIGYLGITPRNELSEAHDLVFAQEQSQTFLIIAMAMVVISMLISIPVAGGFVRPIKRLAAGTRRLISGKFNTRIPVTTQDELGTLSSDFNTLATTLSENEKARQQWVADISHELRTPLAILRGEVEAIEDGIRQPTPDNIRSLGQEVNHLGHLVNDLYELSMSDIGALNYQKMETDMTSIIEDCVDSFRGQFTQKSITLSLRLPHTPPPLLLADPQRIKQLINNLLKNSYRYTDAGGTSHVSVDVNRTHLCIHIDDSAPGVPTHEIPKLFERLYRVEGSRNRSKGGAGLGLAICNNIVSAHEGQIYAQPSMQGGLKISVELPITTGHPR